MIVREIDGPFEWIGETGDTHLRVLSKVPLPVSKRVRAYLEPIPADLAPPAGISTCFQRGTLTAFLAYRVTRAPHWIWLVGFLGIAMLAAAIVAGTTRKQLHAPRPTI
ncbi:hypothetical protein ACFL6M_06895 [Candidatus Eisenbacteria bacterium]|uniref:PepSY domain-containing protein n=1 Tax=Eiseniibacteriota bacterium TaxID=2212470 RepID=A0ABV6YLX1_UNCEI